MVAPPGGSARRRTGWSWRRVAPNQPGTGAGTAKEEEQLTSGQAGREGGEAGGRMAGLEGRDKKRDGA